MNKNDFAWEQLFQKYDILTEVQAKGHFYIDASMIREFREPRLMTKFDHETNLPFLFKENNLAILPVSRGRYVIGKFKLYKQLQQYSGTIKRFPFPLHLESLKSGILTSEAAAINAAAVSGILEDFLGVDILVPTVDGRMGSGEFTFTVDDKSEGSFVVHVENAQVEIDGGFESSEALTLIEAKCSLCDDFLIRQLYYPYYLWHKQMSKQVRSLFFLYSNGLFYLYEYRFTRTDDYNSLELVKSQAYLLIEKPLNLDELEAIWNGVSPEEVDCSIPFPQADNFPKLISLAEQIERDGARSKSDITTLYDFDLRQSDYYLNAGRYLGLFEKLKSSGEEWSCDLSQSGKSLMQLPLSKRLRAIARLLFQLPSLHQAFGFYLRYGEVPTREEAAQFLPAMAESTKMRRAGTICRWLDWLVSQCEEPTLFS